MILKTYTVYDQAVKAFLQPFFARQHGEAIRNFTSAIQDPKTGFNAHPSDYSLWYSGDFDDSNGNLTPAMPPEKILDGIEVITNDGDGTKPHWNQRPALNKR